MQKPQPVNPELTSQSITGILDTLNNFRGKSQPLVISPQSLQQFLGMRFLPFVILFFSDMKIVYDFPKLLSLFSLNSYIIMIKTKFSNLYFSENGKQDTYFQLYLHTNKAREEPLSGWSWGQEEREYLDLRVANNIVCLFSLLHS